MKIFTGLRNNFFAGLLAILPIVLTIVIIRFLFNILNDILLEPIVKMSVPFLRETHLVVVAKIIALLLTLIIITAIGTGPMKPPPKSLRKCGLAGVWGVSE